ncbi:serine protease inhibitor Cvsi-2-like [Argopecten irradians]|uniref:serine protease inhibitor Cvsi-2-like n=1 Tax=Argopecten irradians TaxID=31199 RepID=UPI0037248083
MKVAIVLALLVVTVYTVSGAGNTACSSDTDCTGDCPAHHGFILTNVCHHNSCHCHSTHACTTASDCSCTSTFTATCPHGHCQCHKS